MFATEIAGAVARGVALAGTVAALALGTARRDDRPSLEEEKATLRALNENYVRSFMQADASWYDANSADDFICVRADGSVQEKSAFLEAAKAGPGTVVSYDLSEVDVRIHGESAFVTALGTWRRTDGVTGKTRYIDAYAKVNGRWKVVSAQLTRAGT